MSPLSSPPFSSGVFLYHTIKHGGGAKPLIKLQSLSPSQTMKRPRQEDPKPQLCIKTNSKTPSTPPTPQTLDSVHHSKTNPTAKIPKILFKALPLCKSPEWVPLNIERSELCLPLTFPTGQTFRWKQTATSQFTGSIGSHLISLKHLPNGDTAYCLHYTPCEENARPALLDFLNMSICLSEVWDVFSASDSRFAALAPHLSGARVLRQDPLECLIQFLCSSNNNIARITKMVDYLSSLGNYLGTVEGIEFHEFPSLDRLLQVSEEELREAGFGYRAKYIVSTVNALRSKPGGGVEWLKSLRKFDLQEAVDALCTLPGVGPKVAACIALFSLDQHHAIPVDTHVWQIATRYLLPELVSTRLTPKLSVRVAEAFVNKYGKYAGWAQTVLFIAELPSQKAILPSDIWNIMETTTPEVGEG